MPTELLLRNCVLAFVLTALIGAAQVFIGPDGPFNSFILVFLIAVISIAPANTIFLLLLYHLNIAKVFLADLRFLLVEIVVLYLISIGVGTVINLLPADILLYKEPGITGRRFVFNPEAELAYSFLLLLGLILIFNKFRYGRFLEKNEN